MTSFSSFSRLPQALRKLGPAVATLAILFGAASSMATTYVMMTDDELLDRAGVVVLARVTASESAPVSGKPSTDYTIEIERLIKGFVPAGTLVVRNLGGVRPSGEALKVHGMPAFSPGERVLLFLSSHEDGTYRLTDMALGAFQELTLPGQSIAMRSLAGSHAIDLPGDTRAEERRRAHQPRNLTQFADWLSDRAAGIVRPVDYFTELPTGGLFTNRSAFTITMSGPSCSPSLPLRWPDFDQGEKIRHRANSSGQAGVPGGGFSEIQAALSVWERDSRSNVDLTYSGTTSVDSVETADGINPYVFEDPSNEISGSFGSSGGTVAINLVFFLCAETHTYAGGQAHSILETGTVTQDGTGDNFFSRSSSPALAFAEVMAHETGHSLGLAHACGDSESPACTGAFDAALMNAFVHDDGRGASLSSDDRQGIRSLYPQAVNNAPPTAPTGLMATATSTSSITVSWMDNSSNETGFELQEADLVNDFATVQTLPAGTMSVDITGLADASYRSYRVRAVTDDTESDFSNEDDATTDTFPGTCTEDGNTLCLNGGRFRITTAWETTQGTSGSGDAVELTADTGYFTFFDANNIEAVVKVLDACSFANHFWVFAGGLTDVRVALQVTDTSSGKVITYLNPVNTPFAPIQDTTAFMTCP